MTPRVAIGLEIHVQLATRTKLFCGDVVAFGAEPNTHVCPVCLGLPGALPVLNGEAVRLAVRAAAGLHCAVHETSVFVRKNYFYPDLPKGYQITQLDRPLATDGWLDAPGEDGGEPARVRIRRVHLEEDAGKSLHDRVAARTAVDLNRAGVPLMEIVTEPDLAGPAATRRFLTMLKRTLEYLAVSDCDMEKGSLRVDANVSLRSADGSPGTPTELKNLNSFAQLERALRHEAERQAALVAAGGEVVAESRLWDADAGETRPMRAKGEVRDYRYFPDPDLPPLVVRAAEVDAARAALPEDPAARARRLVAEYDLPEYDAEVLTASRPLADYFEATAAGAEDPKAASNWIMTEVLAWLNERGAGIDAYPVPPERLAELIALVRDGTVSHGAGREVLTRVAETGRAPAEVVEREGLAQVSDDARLAAWVDEVVAAHPAEAARLAAGEERLLDFLMGRVMERSGGKADPVRVRRLIRDRAASG